MSEKISLDSSDYIANVISLLSVSIYHTQTILGFFLSL